MPMKNLILLTALFCIKITFAQETDFQKIKPGPPIRNTDSVIILGMEYHDKKEYDNALVQYQLVNENDSNYVLAQIEIANTYLAMKKDSATLQICKKVAHSNYTYRQNILLLMAVAYENLKLYDEALNTYKQGIKEFPLSAKFYHELAIYNTSRNNYKEAVQNFSAALKVNPYYAPTHFQLGVLALKQKKIIPAMLAWQFYLICDNSSKRASKVITNIEKIGDDAINYEELGTIDPIDQNDDFSDIESIVKSKAAYNAKFKPLADLNFRLLKQVQVVLEKIEFNSGDKGFYNQFYAKFFTELNKNGFTEIYLYYLLSGQKIEDVDKWNTKNKEKVEKFGNWISDYIRKEICQTTYEVNGKTTPAIKLFYNNELSGIGNLDSKSKIAGYWQFYHSGTSILKSQGNFNSSYEKEGEWKFFHKNGKLKEHCSYVKGKLNGDYKEYYENGKLKQNLTYAEGKLNGKQKLYFSNGALKGEYDYVNDVFTGYEYAYYSGGQLKFKVQIKDAKYDGELTHYYPNGSKKEVLSYSKDNKEGKYVEYFPNPKDKIKSEGMYTENFPTGEWKYYYENGKISNQGSFGKKGLKDGVWKTYTPDGVLYSDDTYSNGKSEGVGKAYYEDGKVYEEFYYKKNRITSYKYYDKSGKLVKEQNKQKNEFVFELYNPNGTIRKTGKTIGENLDGPLVSYDAFGIKVSYVDYVNDIKSGAEQSFFTNGQLKTDYKYKDGEALGMYTRYNSLGKITLQGYYENSQEQGYWITYNHDGSLSEINYYMDGRKTGWQRLFACDGKITRAENIKDGYIRERLYYDTLGNILQKTNYDSSAVYLIKNQFGSNWFSRPIKNNLLDGTSYNYYPNGKASSERIFIMDLENGVSKTYDEFGKLATEEVNINDELNGMYKVYDEGKLAYTANYFDNKLHGEETYYHDNGKVFFKSVYNEGSIVGEQECFDENGELAIKKFFENDNLVAYTYSTETGTLAPKILITGPDAKVKSYFKNKNVAIEYAIKNNDKEGKSVLNFSNGNRMIEENYSAGYLHGPRTTYYASGKVKTKENYFHNQLSGAFAEFYENGKAKKNLSYRNGKKHGLYTFYDETGKLVLKCYYYNDNVLKFIN